MAKRRLNKKVALIGSVIFVFLVLAAIGVVLHLSRDPEKFIKDGDAALIGKDYKRTERNYNKARHLAKTDSLRIEILFKLVDMYIETDQWNKVRGCWNEIIRIDPKNVKARLGRLKYIYIAADTGARGAWKEVESQASEFIEVADEDLLAEDTAKWETVGVQEARVAGEQMGPYLYLLRGRAVLEMARLGAVTDPDESLAGAIDDLEKVRQLQPDNIDAYWYLAQAAVTKGELFASRGNFEERDKAIEQAKELLEQAVEAAGANPRAHINLLTVKLMLAKRGDRVLAEEQIQSLEPEYLLLVEKFASSAEAFSALAGFYQQLGPKNLDRAIEAIEKAIELDKENVTYAISAANSHYRKFSIYGQNSEIYKAIEIAKNALTLPDTQDKPGPRQWANKRNRLSLCAFLANCYIEQVLEPCEPRTESQKQKWIADAEQAVHEIEQIFGSGEEPQVIKWRGMLELAKGNRNRAIKKMYMAYEQFKSANQRDSLLSYRLAKLFENTTELGAAQEFFESALSGPGRIDEKKPQALLDYADVLLKLMPDGSGALSVVNFFENKFWANQRSQTLRINALLAAKQLNEVEEELAKAEPDDPNTIKLNLALVQAKIEQVKKAMAQKRAKERLDWLSGVVKERPESQADDEVMTDELKGYNNALAELVEKLLLIEPNFVGEASITAVCNYYITEGKTEQAKDLVDRFLGYFPDNAAALFFKQIFSEPEPDKIPEQRRKEIEEQLISNITDPIARAMNLGVFYDRNNELDKAAGEFKKVLKIEALQEGVVERPAFDQTKKITDSQRLAASYLFEIALKMKNWELVEQIGDVVRRENVDACTGNFFAARIAMVKEQYRDALARIEECLRQRSVFSRGFMLRSNINAALGNERASIEDARKAASLDPLDGAIAKRLAFVLYQRNQKLGDNVSPNQVIEARVALERAWARNPGDLELLSFYAEYISPTEPLKALAIRQNLQKVTPNMQNAILLGELATRIAVQETIPERKEALFAIAASSLEQARRINPHDKIMLYHYAEYYRARGQNEKAKQLLLESDDQKLLWAYYLRTGQFENAKEALEQLYQTEAKDSSVVKGLLLIAQKTADEEAVKKYSEELLLLEENIENRLAQIQAFLEVGLIKEAEYKLQSFKEKYPDELRALLLEAWLAMKQGQLKRALNLTNRNLESTQDNAVAWRLRGEINRLMANYDQAIIDLRRSKSLADVPVTRITLAKAYLRVGREEDAIIELKNTIDHPQAPVESRALLEQIYLHLGKKEALKKFYDETLEKFPDSVLWYNRAGAFAFAENDFSRAEQLYGQAWQNSKKGSKGNANEAFNGYLQALLLRGKLDKVFEEAGKYVDSDFAPIAFIGMAEAKLKLGDKAKAIQYCRKAVDKARTNGPLAFNTLQRMYSLLGAEEVLKVCKERLEANPDSFAANWAMFNLTKISAEYNKAIGYIDKCLQIAGPDSPRRIDYIMKKTEVLSLAYNKTSDNIYLKGAIAEYESLLAKMPNNTIVLNNLSYMLAENNEKLAEALEYAKRAHETNPNNPNVLDTYSYVLYKNGRFSEAAEFLQAALQQYERNKISAPMEVYKHLGQICEKLGDREKALAAYKQALEIGADILSEATKEQIKLAIERLSQEGE